jgi:hypothetical protein
MASVVSGVAATADGLGALLAAAVSTGISPLEEIPTAPTCDASLGLLGSEGDTTAESSRLSGDHRCEGDGNREMRDDDDRLDSALLGCLEASGLLPPFDPDADGLPCSSE